MEKTLELIGSLKVGQKFCIRNDKMDIEPNPRSIVTIARRWYTSNNRDNTIDHIEKVIKQAFLEKQSSKSILLARDGIVNLRETYKTDQKTGARINEVIKFIDKEIKILEHHEYIVWQNSSDRSSPISFPPSPSCAITVSTGAKGQILSTSLSATSSPFTVGSLPKSSKKR